MKVTLSGGEFRGSLARFCGLSLAVILVAAACSSSRSQRAAWEGPFGKRLGDLVYVARPSGSIRSVVVFGHGWSDYTPVKYRKWFDHLVADGNAIIYPRYQATDSFAEWNSGDRIRSGWFRGIRTGFAHLGGSDVPVVAAGYSAGATLAYLYATRAAAMGLPVPRTVNVIFPGGTVEFIPNAGHVQPFPLKTRVLIQVGDRDTVVGTDGGDVIWRSLRAARAANKRYEVVHSSGDFVAEHGAPQMTSKEARRAFWAPLDASIAAARAEGG